MIKLLRLGQALLAAACGYVVGVGVEEITNPWIAKLENRGIAEVDAVRYQPTEQERLDRIEEEISEDA